MKKEEPNIESMYREFQEQRETISQESYNAIRQAAYDYQDDQRIEKLKNLNKKIAVEKYGGTEPNQITSSDTLLSKLVNQINNLLSQIGTVPFAATAAALIIALVTIIPNIYNTSSGYRYDVSIFSEEDQYISDVIQSLEAWQYGFVSPENPTHSAFKMGTLLVDYLTLNSKSNSELTTQLQQSLLSLAQASNDIKTTKLLKSYIRPDIPEDQLIQSLEEHYSNHAEYDYFVIGQWVEFHYLLSKIAIRQQNPSIFNNRQNSDIDVNAVVVELREIDNLKFNDIERLRVLFEQQNIDLASILELSKLLLNIRTTATTI